MGGDVMHIWLRNMSLLGNRIAERSKAQAAGVALADATHNRVETFEGRGCT